MRLAPLLAAFQLEYLEVVKVDRLEMRAGAGDVAFKFARAFHHLLLGFCVRRQVYAVFVVVSRRYNKNTSVFISGGQPASSHTLLV